MQCVPVLLPRVILAADIRDSHLHKILTTTKLLPQVCIPYDFEYLHHELCTDTSSPDHPHYQASSPPPNNFQPQGTPAPFYVAGAEVPSHAPSQPQQPPQQYPPRDDTPSLGPPGGKQPAPVNPSSPPPQTFTPYSHPQQPPPQNAAPYAQVPNQQQQQQRPQSTYGAQELATSVYDSPIAPHNPTAAPFGQQQYQSYNPPDQAPPPAPTGQAPPPPNSMSPAPLQPGGAAYDARHGLPSQGAPVDSRPPQPQYKPYVPPGDGPSPNDYYRQGGNPY